MTAAIVMGVTTNGLAVVRSLGRRGIPVTMMEWQTRPGMRSRFGTPLLMPSIYSQPETWLATIVGIGRDSSCKPVLIPTGDEYVLFVSQHRDFLREHVRFSIPSA